MKTVCKDASDTLPSRRTNLINHGHEVARFQCFFVCLCVFTKLPFKTSALLIAASASISREYHLCFWSVLNSILLEVKGEGSNIPLYLFARQL